MKMTKLITRTKFDLIIKQSYSYWLEDLKALIAIDFLQNGAVTEQFCSYN